MTTQNNPHKFTLGQELRDKVTGFEGIASHRLEYLNGCVQYCLKPPIHVDKPRELPEGHYIDDQQLELVSEGILDPPGHRHPAVGGDIREVSGGGPSHREGELPT
jgi:hypothetical protein